MATGTIKIQGVYELSPTLSKTSGNSTVKTIQAWQSGKVIQLFVDFNKTGTTSTGSNFFEGTLSGIPLPIASKTFMAAYSATSTLTMGISSAGTVIVRVTAANTASGTYESYCQFGGTYICE